MNFKSTMDQVEALIEQRRMRSARRLYEEVLSQYPEHTQFVAFNYGVLNQMFLGGGEEARRLYRLAVDSRSGTESLVESEALNTIEANACENMMLLSLSNDEYDEWASRLEKLQPQNPILSEHRSAVHTIRDRGHSWSSAMLWMAKTYWDVDPFKDPGMHGAGASIYQLVLKHRKTLRLPRDEQRVVITGYTGLLVSIWSDCGSKMETSLGAAEPEEFSFILADALPLIEEAATANASDEKVRESLRMLKQCLEVTADFSVSASGHPGKGKALVCPACEAAFQTGPREIARCPKCGATFSDTDSETDSQSLAKKPGAWWLVFWIAASIVVGAVSGHLLAGFLLAAILLIGAAIGSFVMRYAESAQGSASRLEQMPGRIPSYPMSGGTAGEGIIRWRTNSQLAQAVHATGISGLRFEMVGAGLGVDQSLELKFVPLRAVPVDKEQNASFALRCIVGLTFPYVVSTVRELEVSVAPDAEYSVRLGPGVRMQMFWIQSGGESLGPLQMTSEVSEGDWCVYVMPFVGSFEQIPIQRAIFSKLVPAFERLTHQQMTL